MIKDERILVEHFAVAVGGQNSGDDPELLAPTQYSKSRNITVRGGRVRSRPGFKKVVPSEMFPQGNYQGIYWFDTKKELLLSVSGGVYTIKPSGNVTEGNINPLQPRRNVEKEALVGNPLAPRVWFENAGIGYIVIQDGSRRPRIYDGRYCELSKRVGGIPVGTLMRFANGRLHLVSTGSRRSLKLGDILEQGDPSTALKFTETGYFLGGGDFQFPSEITALIDIPRLDTTTGQGSMLIGTKNNLYSLRTEITDRDAWGQTPAFQTHVLPIGVAGHGAITQVNTDVYFRSPDGLRSARLAVTDMSQPGFGGLQQEIPERFQNWRIRDSKVIYFNDRLLVTVDPIQYKGKTIYQGLVALNFDSLNKIGEKSPPVYDGFWDNILIRDMVVANDRCFIVTASDGGNELWELHRDGFGLADESPPVYCVETKAMNGGDPSGLKSMHRLDLWFSQLQDDLEVSVDFRVDKAGYLPWSTFKVSRQAGKDRYAPVSSESYISKVTMPTPDPTPNGNSFQFRIHWTGRAKLDLVKSFFRPLAESHYQDVPLPATEVGVQEYALSPSEKNDKYISTSLTFATPLT